jgi:multicomponent Na+:H+ antiporter subunit A
VAQPSPDGIAVPVGAADPAIDDLEDQPVTALVLAHIGAAAVAPWLVRRLGARAFFLLSVVPAITAVWALAHSRAALSPHPPTTVTAWAPSLGMELAFRLDPLAWLMTLVVSVIGTLVLVYCAGYFAGGDEPGLGRFAGALTGFAGAMLGLVTSDDLLVLYLFWEATTVLSYLLIGHKSESRASRSAATQALVVTTFGGLAMLVGVILLGESTGSYRLSELLANPPSGTLTSVAIALVLLGAVSKSALLPFHFWLPGAMAAPTPVSAYLHAAAMVKAGIYLIARFAPAFAHLQVWRTTVLVLGGATMLVGGYRALRQHDLKLLLAYGTVSLLGFLTVLVGLGNRDAALAGLTLVLSHALFKGCVFLVVGTIDHATGTRDLRTLSGLRRSMPVLFWTSVIALASMAGLPPTLGFVGKEAAYAALLHGGPVPGAAGNLVVLAVLVLGSVLTIAYSARFLWGAFRTIPESEPTPVHRPVPVTVGVPALLAVASLLAAPVASAAEPVLRAASGSWPATPDPVHLGFWHGFNGALLLSAVTVALGALLAWRRRAIARFQSGIPPYIAADRFYRTTMRSLDRLSIETTGYLQRGSLQLNLALILSVLIAVPGAALLLGVTWPSSVRSFDTIAQPAVAVIMIAAAYAAARARRRLRGVFLVGVTGYGTAMLFLLHGAPDLALTQVLVETFSLVVFVLVLRRLPGKFDDHVSRRHGRIRLILGLGVGAVTTGLALTATAVRNSIPSSATFAESAKDFGGGANIVNVTLVDIRPGTRWARSRSCSWPPRASRASSSSATTTPWRCAGGSARHSPAAGTTPRLAPRPRGGSRPATPCPRRSVRSSSRS